MTVKKSSKSLTNVSVRNAFRAAYAENFGSTEDAALECEINPSTARSYLSNHPLFAQACERALTKALKPARDNIRKQLQTGKDVRANAEIYARLRPDSRLKEKSLREINLNINLIDQAQQLKWLEKRKRVKANVK